MPAAALRAAAPRAAVRGPASDTLVRHRHGRGGGGGSTGAGTSTTGGADTAGGRGAARRAAAGTADCSAGTTGCSAGTACCSAALACCSAALACCSAALACCSVALACCSAAPARHAAAQRRHGMLHWTAMRHSGTRPPDWLSVRQDVQLHVHDPRHRPEAPHGHIARCIDSSLAVEISIRVPGSAPVDVADRALFCLLHNRISRDARYPTMLPIGYLRTTAT